MVSRAAGQHRAQEAHLQARAVVLVRQVVAGAAPVAGGLRDGGVRAEELRRARRVLVPRRHEGEVALRLRRFAPTAGRGLGQARLFLLPLVGRCQQADVAVRLHVVVDQRVLVGRGADLVRGGSPGRGVRARPSRRAGPWPRGRRGRWADGSSPRVRPPSGWPGSAANRRSGAAPSVSSRRRLRRGPPRPSRAPAASAAGRPGPAWAGPPPRSPAAAPRPRPPRPGPRSTPEARARRQGPAPARFAPRARERTQCSTRRADGNRAPSAREDGQQLHGTPRFRTWVHRTSASS